MEDDVRRATSLIRRSFLAFSILGIFLAACDGGGGSDFGSGGTTSSGGGGATGGASSSGGTANGGGNSGGSVSAGGAMSGGAATSGGTSSTGGASQGGGSGGASSGGTLGGTGGTVTGGGTSGGGSGGAETGGSGGEISATCPTTATLKAGDTTLTVMSEGQERTFLVHAPASYDGTTRVPVVFDFHGLSGNSNQQKNLSNWDEVADANGFLAVYPQGVDNAWNAGQCCTDATDDVSFVRSVIEELNVQACVDPKRIYASGCSNGGGMSYKLACKAADVIAGIAPVDFDCVDGASCADCDPSRTVPVIQFRGTGDTLVDYDGAGPFAGAQQNFSIWSELNMCTGAAETYSGNMACEVYPTCGNGAETALCTVNNGPHCGSYTNFMIPQVAWEFLRNRSLP